ncbi:MAG: AraC family transcriptional regulator [Anaerolineae bacterium]|nr:AraC family transcriptional regulator [Anaerolineae bacterium]
MIPTYYHEHTDSLLINTTGPVVAHNAGLFVSNGTGIHPRRTLPNYELIFLVKGTLNMAENGQRFDMEAGQALILWPGREHTGTASYNPQCSFYWLVFQLAQPPESNRNRKPELTISQVVTVVRPDHLTSLFRRFLDDQEAKCLQPIAANCLATLMLCELATPQLNDETNQAVVLARHAQQYVVSNFRLPISTSQIANTLGCNPDYLGRCFRAVYGHTLTEAIHRQRLKVARAMLLDSTETVEAIARNCGFGNAIFFRRVFKRYEGVSPSTFRHLYARIHFNSL